MELFPFTLTVIIVLFKVLLYQQSTKKTGTCTNWRLTWAIQIFLFLGQLYFLSKNIWSDVFLNIALINVLMYVPNKTMTGPWSHRPKHFLLASGN